MSFRIRVHKTMFTPEYRRASRSLSCIVFESVFAEANCEDCLKDIATCAVWKAHAPTRRLVA